MAAIQAAKATLRREIHNKILALSSEEKNRQSENVLKKLFQNPIFQSSKRISIYVSTEHEISTDGIIRKMFENGQLCFVPRYHKAVMEMVKLHSMQDWDQLPLTKWNIKQPQLSEQRENALESGGLELIIIPGVAFTANGKRLGHGKGYYDTFLANLKKHQHNDAVTIALAFKEQILNDIPTHEHDVKLDYVLYSD